MRRAARTDSTQGAIVDALRGVGALVWIVGRELDLVVLYPRTPRGRVYLMDTKTGRAARRTPSQKEMVQEGWPITFPTTVEEALMTIGAI